MFGILNVCEQYPIKLWMLDISQNVIFYVPVLVVFHLMGVNRSAASLPDVLCVFAFRSSFR